LAEYSSIPVIKRLKRFLHPTQVLADLMTIQEYKGRISGLKLAYIGDGNNMANSLLLGGTKMGMRVVVASPQVLSAGSGNHEAGGAECRGERGLGACC
jgi:ornithine carbamoyltransferase